MVMLPKDSCAGGRCLINTVLSCVGDGFEKMLDVEGVSLHQPFKERLMLGRSKKFIQPAVLPAPGEHRGPSLLSCCEHHLQRFQVLAGKTSAITHETVTFALLYNVSWYLTRQREAADDATRLRVQLVLQ